MKSEGAFSFIEEIFEHTRKISTGVSACCVNMSQYPSGLHRSAISGAAADSRNCQPWAKHLSGHGNSTFYDLVRNTTFGHSFGTNALRISRSFAFTLTSFSWPIRTRIFWPAESSSSFGSANSYSTLG